MTKFFLLEKYSPTFHHPPKPFSDFFISIERGIPIVIFHCRRFHGCSSIEQIKYFLFKRILNNKEPEKEYDKHNKLSQNYNGSEKVTKNDENVSKVTKFFPNKVLSLSLSLSLSISADQFFR